MEYLKYFDSLLTNRLITPIWREVLLLIDNELGNDKSKDDYLILFTILFSLIDDGNICMSIDKNILLDKWENKLEGARILLEEIENLDKEKFDYVKDKSIEVINSSLTKLVKNNLDSVIGQNKFFIIDDNWIYVRKYLTARKIILASLNRLFDINFVCDDFNYKEVVIDSFNLTSGQENVVKQGLSKNLVISGGPGTGKTTSILFLLLALLVSKEYDDIYLLAPSGKAASRMKDSIKGGLHVLKDEFKNKYPHIIDKIANLKSYTIHSLLSLDKVTSAFLHNENFQFSNNSIFIIDEASMIDVTLFASLLSSISTGSRVFIMGDKNQLPSVDAGAVFGDLIKKKSLIENGNICELGEAVRFKVGSPIYELANAINNDDVDLPKINWQNKILEIQDNITDVINPVYYFANPIENEKISEKEIIQKAVLNFGKRYYSTLQVLCSDIDYDDPKEFKLLFDKVVKQAEILCAENLGIRGVNSVNSLIKSTFIDKSKPTSIDGYYPGELMIINKNNKTLDLSNGDSGVLVTFRNDKTLYFMVEKDSEIIKFEKKSDGKIFKLGGYMFYPLSLISKDEISNAYAITIHKSQGSDYKNILVILPSRKGHPLLNRQIVYTAITRTKGDTYILSNQNRIMDAKKTIIKRDTNIK